jgi:coenzyme F420 hydrogenase subunit beta
MLHQIKNLKDVVDWGLCTGCGACSYHCRKGNIKLVNMPAVGIRPQFDSDACATCTECLAICPGYRLDGELETGHAAKTAESEHEFGTALEIWEGHASNPEIRFRGSSGGILSALALYCLEQEKMKFVLHSGADDAKPWTNTTLMSTNRSEILACTGSRYAPASPCDGLRNIEESDGPCVFIGKPCDVAAVAMLRREHPKLDQNLGLVLTFFCAGTPSTKGTLDLLTNIDVDPAKIKSLRYRGEGWPGTFHAVLDDGSATEPISYTDSWNHLTGYRPLRCNLCPDGLGRIADISCGDAWHALAGSGEAGRSLVLVRTERGMAILHGAIAAGYVELVRVGPEAVLAAQTSLLQRRRELFGRLLAMKLLMIPAPKFVKFSLLRGWLTLSLQRQVQTIMGTIRRAASRGWWRRRPVVQTEPARELTNA